MWIDDSKCDSDRFHVIEKRDDKWIVTHADKSECDVVEFDISDLVSPDAN